MIDGANHAANERAAAASVQESTVSEPSRLPCCQSGLAPSSATLSVSRRRRALHPPSADDASALMVRFDGPEADPLSKVRGRDWEERMQETARDRFLPRNSAPRESTAPLAAKRFCLTQNKTKTAKDYARQRRAQFSARDGKRLGSDRSSQTVQRSSQPLCSPLSDAVLHIGCSSLITGARHNPDGFAACFSLASRQRGRASGKWQPRRSHIVWSLLLPISTIRGCWS